MDEKNKKHNQKEKELRIERDIRRHEINEKKITSK